MQQKINHGAPFFETAQKQNVEMDFMEKYDSTPPINRSIDRSYFLKSYRYGFIIFSISFILFYLLICKNGNYLIYIIISFIFYLFVKVLIFYLFESNYRH